MATGKTATSEKGANDTMGDCFTTRNPVWECSGYAKDGAVKNIYWSCRKCGYEVRNGWEPPLTPCPMCNNGGDEKTAGSACEGGKR